MAISEIIDITGNVFVRPSLFLVSTSFANMPNNVKSSQELEGGLLIKSTTLPGTSIGTVEIPYRGRKIYLPTHRQLPGDISMSIIYHKGQDWHKEFTSWMDSFQTAAGTEIVGVEDPTNDFMTIESRNPAIADIEDGDHFQKYTLYGCIPTSIGAAELSAESAESLLEFTINIQYTYHEVEDGTGTGNSNASDGKAGSSNST